ncbi:hypothetical protein D3C80_1099890 [compost metagenome]
MLKGIQQADQHLQQLLADALRAYLGANLRGQAQAVAQVVDVDTQRVVAVPAAGQGLDAFQGFALRLLFGLAGAVAVVEHGTEQRCRRGHTAAALGQGQRGMLVHQQRTQALVGQAHTGLHTQPLQVQAQRQGIDEHAQAAVGPRTALQAAEQHGAEYHAVLATGGGHQPRPGQV